MVDDLLLERRLAPQRRDARQAVALVQRTVDVLQSMYRTDCTAEEPKRREDLMGPEERWLP